MGYFRIGGQPLSTPDFAAVTRDNARTETVSVVMFVERRNDQRRLLQWIETCTR